MHIRNYFGLVGVAFLMACGGNTTQQANVEQTKDTTELAEDTQPVAFADEAYSKVFDTYIKLKNQLVATNFEQAKVSATELSTLLASAKGLESLDKSAKQMAESKDIVSQRAIFVAFNTAIISSFKQAKLKAGTIYLQHCPMANNGDGADWMSAEKKIQNPYYGDEMLECGAVTEKLKTL